MEKYRAEVLLAGIKAAFGEGVELSENDLQDFRTLFTSIVGSEMPDDQLSIYLLRIKCHNDEQIENVLKERLGGNVIANRNNIKLKAFRAKEFIVKRMEKIFSDPEIKRKSLIDARNLWMYNELLLTDDNPEEDDDSED